MKFETFDRNGDDDSDTPVEFSTLEAFVEWASRRGRFEVVHPGHKYELGTNRTENYLLYFTSGYD